MPENQDRRVEFEKYDHMTTEELEEILRKDFEAPPEQEIDTELLLYVTRVLAERDRQSGYTGKKAQEEFESFAKNYKPKTVREKKTGSTIPRWVRTMTAAAAVLAVIFLGTVTAKAFGFDVWEAVVEWTAETFHICIGDRKDSNEPGKADALPYASLEEALEKAGVTTKLAPTWIPEGYELTEITVEDTPVQKNYFALYQSDQGYIKITIWEYLNTYPVFLEQSDGLLETYEMMGIRYYLFHNHEQVKAAWIRDKYECYISGNLTIEELKLMIDSIEKG